MRQMIKDPTGIEFEAEVGTVDNGRIEYRVWLIYSGSERQWVWRDRSWLEACGYVIPE